MSIPTDQEAPAGSTVKTVDQVVIRFAGDSGDGMQITGGQFTNTSALAGNDLATFPDFPAEIRAPAGTLPGVSGFQVRFSSFDIHSPGDTPDVLVAMNPAALKVNIPDIKPNAIVIVNSGNFGSADLKKAAYDYNPLESSDLDGFRVIQVDLNKFTSDALADTGLDFKAQLRCKNFFALGITYWIFSRNLDPTIAWLSKKFAKKPIIAEANVKALRAGYNFCDIAGVFQERFEVPPADLPAGTYRNIMGNQATGLGLVAAARKAGLQLFLGSYPITPATDILHQLAAYKNYGVLTFQAEDEIAAVCASVGAAFAGNLAITTTSGPGLALKGEGLGLAMMTELPLVVVNVQRGGPSTGLPTKTEQADLMQAMYGRNGECPVAVIAAQSPGDCFQTAFEACRIALEHMVPVILLTDGYLANGAEPWKLPDVDAIPAIKTQFHAETQDFLPYSRDPETLARPWAIPGTPGLEHRIGGLEKDDGTGNVSYDAQNHEFMCRTRAEKVARIANDIPEQTVVGNESGDLLIISWGGTYGSIAGPAIRAAEAGASVGWCHLKYLNPLPRNLGDIIGRFKKVLVPELNLGQLVRIIRDEYGVDAAALNKVQGRPFTTSEIAGAIEEQLR
ncbi:MAG: 2-oxoglutarate ferredoxin oxidoreductase subunit alpha [Planctomycetes bacterium]|nr:2-oxoglutarate ferredoxin oxidoreductase subunit alpha [Planctomycetota bacterium]